MATVRKLKGGLDVSSTGEPAMSATVARGMAVRGGRGSDTDFASGRAFPQRSSSHRCYPHRRSAEDFLIDAEMHLDRARAAETLEEQVVLSYRAMLRAAGALIEVEMMGRKRRLSGSAWSKLRRLDSGGEHWAELGEAHGRLASRAEMGLSRGLNPSVVSRLLEHTANFVDRARSRVEYMPSVA